MARPILSVPSLHDGRKNFHGGDMPTALRVVLATSLASLVTIPFWLGWALKFLS
ncbi:MAG: hypothetical protein ACKOF3_08520 [Spartobacteria bacterium]